MKIGTAVEMKADKKVGSLYLYDEIAPDGYDWWTGKEIKSETSATTVADKLSRMGDISELNVYICSKGGDMATGSAIYSQLSRLQVPKTAYIDGLAASIATVIACACDKIIMGRTSVFMIHNAAMEIYGNAEELRRGAEILDTYTAAARQAYVGKCSLTEAEITDLMDKESYMTAEQALEYGFADEIADSGSGGFASQNADRPEGYGKAAPEMRAKDTPRDFMAAVLERLDSIESRLSDSKTPENEVKAAGAEEEAKAKQSPVSREALEAFLKAFTTVK